MTTQDCPNCGTQHDIRVYVSGQKVTCRCGIRFEVRRHDISGTRAASGMPGFSASAPTRPDRGQPVTLVPGGDGDKGTVSTRNTYVPGANGTPLPSKGSSGVEISLDGSSPGPSGVALPQDSHVGEDSVGATMVRSSTAARTPDAAHSGDSGPGISIHDVDTLVGGTRLRLPGFELQELLGRGGMGEVWRARQQSLGRTVAVKVLPPRLAKDPEFVTRFEKEATALAALNHPHIVQIIDRGVAGEHYYFVMEFVEGRSLREAMGPGKLAPQQALKLMLQAARAIECAHEKDIIHRDLKPENLLLDGRGHVKVADFGLAGMRGPDSRLNLTATSVAMGTLNYMAPEQRRDAKNVDGRADLFSLGVVLYEVLTGELPLGRFKLPSVRVPGLDPRVDAIVERLLETEPEARYANARELCEALETLVTTSSAPGMVAPERKVRAAARPASTVSRKLRMGWRRVSGGLSLVGGLAVIGLAARWLVGPVALQAQRNKATPEAQAGAKPTGPQTWPANTYRDLFTVSKVVSPSKPGGLSAFTVNFVDATGQKGAEELNGHSGTWRFEDGKLVALQAGKETDGERLVPRAYVAHRYFSMDDFTAEIAMDVRPLGPEYLSEEDAQHYGELAFRIKDLQVSVFAIPEAGMRLAWRYFSDDGQEIVGNSAQDADNLVGDEMPLPPKSPYKVRLQLKRLKGGVLAEAFVNDKRFARKLLPNIGKGRLGKVALGCRNLACTFSNLKVVGVMDERKEQKEQKK